MNNLRVQGLRLHDLSAGTDGGRRHLQSSPVDICPLPSEFDQEEDDYLVLGCGGDVARVGRNLPGTNDPSAEAASCQSVKWFTQLSQVIAASEEGGDEGTHAAGDRDGGHHNEEDDGQSWFLLSVVDSGNVVAALSHSVAIASVDAATGQAELVGEFENGIFAGAWSPDGEILVLVTRVPLENDDDVGDQDEPKGGEYRFVVLCMNAQFDVLAETDLETCAASDAATISICWRPDASLFAVSSVDAADQQRKIRIFQRETLALCAIGRNEDGSGTLAPNLLSPLCWAGSGCSLLLTTIQTKGRRQLVAFLEPNGLRHGQFVLLDTDSTSTVVLQLDWNVESDLLSVWLRDVATNEEKVQLWHRCNYHWYLKQEFVLTGAARVVRFHPERPYTLLILDNDLGCREYLLQWDASTIAGDPDATAFVIDGRQLNATHFEMAVIPPPMCARSTALARPISHLLPSRTQGPLVAIAVHSDGSMSIIEKPQVGALADGYCVTHVADRSSPMNAAFDPSLLREYCIVSDSTADEIRLVAVVASRTTCETLVAILLTKRSIHIEESIALEGRVLTVTAWSDSDEGALIQLEDGHLMEVACPFDVVPSQAEPLLEPCPWVAALKHVSVYDDGDHGQRTRMVVGRSSRGRLYCQELLLAASASSFILSTPHEYLCFATAGPRCQLRFLSLFELHNFDPLLGSDENRILHGYEPRNIERGARIVSVLPRKTDVVVQMPRGNLELVSPRALVLRKSVRLIEAGEYGKAFALLRKHRVDLNEIVDLHPVRFLKGGHAERFVEQIENIDHLNLFISSLQNPDAGNGRLSVPTWWYCRANKTDSPATEEYDPTNKVNCCCEVLRSIMMEAETSMKTLGGRQVGKGHFLLPILSTFAKQTPPKLEDALQLIKLHATSKHPNATSTKSALFSDYAQSAIQYLAFLAEYELLFETSLGMYDFDVARAVARNSQMDPKTYLPLLKRYRELPENFARYEVDVKLKRFESALRHLHKSHKAGEVVDDTPSEDDCRPNDFRACARLIDEHGLFRLGLELFQDDAQRLQILQALGDFLLREKKDPAAALSVYMSCAPNIDHDRAMNAARQCREWKVYFSLSAPSLDGGSPSDPATNDRRSMLAREVADELVDASKSSVNRRQLLFDAARVILDYGTLHDVAAAADILLKGEWWMEAKRIAHLHSRDDLVRKCVEAAVQSGNSTVSDLLDRRESFVSTLTLYSTSLSLRKESTKGTGVGYDEDEDLGDDSGSLFSMASHASGMSNVTGASTGTSYSVTSSVISVKSTSTFTVTGSAERNRHKSKFNSLGDRKSKPKKKKGRKGRSKAFPGSDQELQGFLQTLRSNCVDETYRDVIVETITFLLRNGHMILAIELYTSYIDLSEAIDCAQAERRVREEQERIEAERSARQEGSTNIVPLTLDIEKEVDSLTCRPFPDTLQRLFSFLPARGA